MEEVQALDFPGRGDAGYSVPFSKVCYIEATDFREADSKDFYGLAPGKSIMLRCGLTLHPAALGPLCRRRCIRHAVDCTPSSVARMRWTHRPWTAAARPGAVPTRRGRGPAAVVASAAASLHSVVSSTPSTTRHVGDRGTGPGHGTHTELQLAHARAATAC